MLQSGADMKSESNDGAGICVSGLTCQQKLLNIPSCLMFTSRSTFRVTRQESYYNCCRSLFSIRWNTSGTPVSWNENLTRLRRHLEPDSFGNLDGDNHTSVCSLNIQTCYLLEDIARTTA